MRKTALVNASKLKLAELNTLSMYSIYHDLTVSFMESSYVLTSELIASNDLILGCKFEDIKLDGIDISSIDRSSLSMDKLIADKIYDEKFISISEKQQLHHYFNDLKVQESDTKSRLRRGTFNYLVNSQSNFKDLDERGNLLRKLNITTLGIEGVISAQSNFSNSINLYNNCDFSMEGVVINESGKEILNWRELAKSEDYKFYLTTDKDEVSWILISCNSKLNPLVEMEDHYYWIHKSLFMAKFINKEKALSYLKVLLEA